MPGHSHQRQFFWRIIAISCDCANDHRWPATQDLGDTEADNELLTIAMPRPHGTIHADSFRASLTLAGEAAAEGPSGAVSSRKTAGHFDGLRTISTDIRPIVAPRIT